MSEQQQQQAVVPIHQWTHGGTKVRILKCVDAHGKGYGGFQWAQSGHVEPETWSEEPTCESGGLFGWPWGLGRGGKEPEYGGKWIVFEVDPKDVVDLNGKVKCRQGEVIYFGDWWTALTFVDAGRIAWIQHAARGAASATGSSGAASATGYRGAASATGSSGAASATGDRGAASATGDRGAASATGSSGAASATGDSGAVAVTGENCLVEISASGAAVVVADLFRWKVHVGAVVLQRWDCGFAVLTAENLNDGQIVTVEKGVIARDGSTKRTH